MKLSSEKVLTPQENQKSLPFKKLIQSKLLKTLKKKRLVLMLNLLKLFLQWRELQKPLTA